MQQAQGAARWVLARLDPRFQQSQTGPPLPAFSGAPSAARGRIGTLDALRGVAALIVVLHHANYMVAAIGARPCCGCWSGRRSAC